MEIEKVNETIKNLEKEQQISAERRRVLELWVDYKGDDRVISSYDALQEIEKEKDKPVLKAKSGILTLDKLLDGFREGQIIVVSATTGVGKSAFCRTLTPSFILQGLNCLWFSYEEGIEEFLSKFPTVPLFYFPAENKQNNIKWLEEKITEGIAKYDCKIIFIDHLHYLIEMQKMAEAKSLSLLVGMMMRELKKIAIYNKVIIFLVCHLKKVYYDKIPAIDDLRDSSFIGQEADTVLFLKRLVENGQETNKATLKVAKNRRTGNLGYVKMIFNNGNYMELTEIEEKFIEGFGEYE